MATTKNVQALERAFAILELMRNSKKGEMSLKEIADGTGLNKSTVFGLVNTMANMGYIQQNESTQKYMLGLKLMSFSDPTMERNFLVKVIHPHLEEISRRFNETAHCAVRSDYEVLYIDKVESPDAPIHINTQIGRTNYLHCTGVGKCVLAYAPDSVRDAFLSGFIPAITQYTITNPDEIRAELENTRAQGYAEDTEEGMIGLYCLAVPVFDPAGNMICSISISTIEKRMALAKENGIVGTLKDAAASITKELRAYV